ncbi:hypothetical protein D3C85_354420 [compost metagenome]
MQEQYPSITPELRAQPTAELAFEETHSPTTDKLEAMRRLIDETYADLMSEDIEPTPLVAAPTPEVAVPLASSEALKVNWIGRAGTNLAFARRER